MNVGVFAGVIYMYIGIMIHFCFAFIKDNDGSVKGFPGAKVCRLWFSLIMIFLKQALFRLIVTE